MPHKYIATGSWLSSLNDSWMIHSLSLPSEILDMIEELQHLRNIHRGGMPEGDTIRCFLAHSPQIAISYLIREDSMVLAEFIIELSAVLGLTSENLLLVSEQRVPLLTEPLDDFVGIDLALIMLDHLYAPGVSWPYQRPTMILMAIAQRGLTNQPYEIQFLRDARIDSQELMRNIHLYRGGHHACKEVDRECEDQECVRCGKPLRSMRMMR